MIEVLGTEVILQMFGVFMFSSATMWSRTGVMTRWLVIVTYVGALLLLIGGPVLETCAWPSRCGSWSSA